MSREQNAAGEPLNDLEAALGALAPARSGLNRDRVMFEAGRAAGARSRGTAYRAWVGASTILAMISLGEGAVLVRWHSGSDAKTALAGRTPAAAAPSVVRPAVEVTVGTRDERFGQPEDWSAIVEESPRNRLMAQVLRYGLDGLPGPAPVARGDAESWVPRSRQDLAEELRKELELGGPS
jgi:hypothetical protein